MISHFDKEIKPEEHFFLKNGRVLKNIYELLNALKSIDAETFEHHVSEVKNDFGSWIRDVFKDEELAAKVLSAKTRDEIIKIIESHIFERKHPSETDVRPAAATATQKNEEAEPAKKKKFVKKLFQKKEKSKPHKEQAPPQFNLLDAVSDELGGLKKEEKVVHETVSDLHRRRAEMQELIKKIPPTLDAQFKAKVTEILQREFEITKREEKIEEIENRLEQELEDLRTKTEPGQRFFSPEFVQGMAVGVLGTVIVVLVYIKFFGGA